MTPTQNELIEKLEKASYHKSGKNTRGLDLDIVISIILQHFEVPPLPDVPCFKPVYTGPGYYKPETPAPALNDEVTNSPIFNNNYTPVEGMETIINDAAIIADTRLGDAVESLLHEAYQAVGEMAFKLPKTHELCSRATRLMDILAYDLPDAIAAMPKQSVEQAKAAIAAMGEPPNFSGAEDNGTSSGRTDSPANQTSEISDGEPKLEWMDMESIVTQTITDMNGKTHSFTVRKPESFDTELNYWKTRYKLLESKNKSVSIKEGAEVVKFVFDLSLIGPDSGLKPEDIARAVAVRWGLAYVD